MPAIICHGCGTAFDPPPGYARSKIQCPGCGVICAVPAGARREPAAAKRAAPPADDDLFRDAPALAPVPKPLPPVPSMELDDVADEDEDAPYDLRDKLGPRCPKCREEMQPGAEACVKCGFNRRTRKTATRAYEPIGRVWESDRPLASRLLWLGLAQAFHLFLGLLCLATAGTAMPAVVSWLPLTLLLCFLLGTYDRITLTRDTKGRVRISVQWRVAFVPLKPVTTGVRGYEGVVSGPWLQVGVLDILVLLSMLSWGVIPGIIWYYTAIHTPHFMVALAQDHGRPEFYVYRGRSQEQMNEIAEALCAATGLHRLG